MRWSAITPATPEVGDHIWRFAWLPTRVGDVWVWWESIEWVYEAYDVEIEHDHWPNAPNYTEKKTLHRWVAKGTWNSTGVWP